MRFHLGGLGIAIKMVDGERRSDMQENVIRQHM
jgi:hypothetical protein